MSLWEKKFNFLYLFLVFFGFSIFFLLLLGLACALAHKLALGLFCPFFLYIQHSHKICCWKLFVSLTSLLLRVVCALAHKHHLEFIAFTLFCRSIFVLYICALLLEVVCALPHKLSLWILSSSFSFRSIICIQSVSEICCWKIFVRWRTYPS